MHIKGHHISPVFIAGLIVVLLSGSVAAYQFQKKEPVEEVSVAQNTPTPESTATPSASAVIASTPTPTLAPTSAPTPKPTASQSSNQLLWMQTDGGWKASGDTTALDCPTTLSLSAPADLSLATSILYPGQTRGGNYKPHGGFRFDSTANDKVKVSAPVDGYIVRGGQYLAEGEIQYTFDVMNNCGVMYRVGHLRVIPENLMALAKSWPAAQEGDSRTHQVNPPVFLAKGATLATTVGIIKDNNTFFDWGVYDYRTTNAASASTAYQQAHASDKELSWHAVCWFDWLSSGDESKVRALPPGDPTSGKKSDYCS